MFAVANKVAVLVIYFVTEALTDLARTDCPKYCKCEGSSINCNGILPHTFPDHIKEVKVTDVYPAVFVDGAFCHPSWTKVTKLTIDCQNSCYAFEMGNNVFRCLERLEVLSLHLERMRNFSRASFFGLQNLLVLDLTKCCYICSTAIRIAFADNTIAPKLSKLVLEQICIYGESESLELDQNVVDMIYARPIAELNLSNTRIDILGIHYERLCHFTKTMNFSNADIHFIQPLDQSKVCSALRILDLSGVNMAKSALLPPYVDLTNKTLTCGNDCLTPAMTKISTLYLNHIVPSYHQFYLRNTSITVTVRNNLKEVHFSGYKILSLDVDISLRDNHLQHLYLTNNNCANIGPTVFENLEFLSYINLEHNKLSNSENFNETFSKLFHDNLMLEEINIAANDLIYLPIDTFLSNSMLQRIVLHDNKLKQICFSISHLKHLRTLDLRNNSIQYLDEFSRTSLDKIYSSQNPDDIEQNKDRKENKTIFVDLRGNPFSCDCKSLDFLRWFDISPIFKSTRHMYFCQTDGQIIPMNEAAIETAKNICEIPIRRRRIIIITSMAASAGLLAIIVGLIVAKKRYRKMLMKRLFNDRLRLLQEEDFGLNFLVFVSFASEDDTFVVANVLQPLKRILNTLCATDRELVCIGDRHFRPGRTIFSEMIRCLDDSAVFIAVMSKNYCSSDYCKLEIEQARLQGKPIILIFIEDVKEDDMTLVIREVFRNYTRVRFILEDGQYRIQPSWEHICESIIQLI